MPPPASPENTRSQELLALLRLEPHPEGGHFREIFRSSHKVQPSDSRPTRSALTNIFFLLGGGEISRWHRVSSDETWHYYEGDGLQLLVAPPDLSTVARVELGLASGTRRPAYTVPAHWWQAARPVGTYALCGCTVAPGFEFADFTFLRDDLQLSARLPPEDRIAYSLL